MSAAEAAYAVFAPSVLLVSQLKKRTRPSPSLTLVSEGGFMPVDKQNGADHVSSGCSSCPASLLADPHAGRVVRYMRPADYAVWGGATAAFPALLYGYGGAVYA